MQPAEAGGKPGEAALEGTVKSGGPVSCVRLPLRGKVARTGDVATSPALTQVHTPFSNPMLCPENFLLHHKGVNGLHTCTLLIGVSVQTLVDD